MGKPVTITLEHTLGKDGARARVDEKFDALLQSVAGSMGLKVEREWVDDQLRFTAKAMGQKITGEVDVFPEHVRIVMVLPTLLAGMAEALKGKVEKDGQLMLDDKSASA
ncbi:MAG: polyhydroxyalkanoic acid system family protein [Pseudomonadota bacterium]